MLTDALRFLINIVFALIVYSALLRFIMQCLRAPFRNPLGQAVAALTDWAVKPLRKVLPGFRGLDWASLIVAWVAQLAWLLALAALGGAALSGPLIGALAALAVIELLKPGHTYEEAAGEGKRVYEAAGVGDQWRGFPGHTVGLATHDVGRPSGPIKPGQVVTVEPIIEFPDKHMHFRVEDTILITEGEPNVLSSGVVKEITDVEKLVGSEAK